MKALLPVLAAATLTLSAGLSQAAEGKDVYNQACAMCHVPGLANAPKLESFGVPWERQSSLSTG